ncbi:MAG: hypothetical protein ACR2GD_14320 [Pyrinomonadaceae bacterium]
MLNEENLISTLEQSLRQFQSAEQRLQARLREVESEAENLKIEIEALQNSAEKTEEALQSLFSTMRGGNKSWKTHKKADHTSEDNYQKKSRFDEDEDYQRQSETRRHPPRPNINNQPLSLNNQRNNPISYLNNQRNVAPINQHFEARSNRFADRTITQACTLLLREAGKPLHVNDLYGYLLEDGFEFKGNNPTISIAVSLNRNRRFRKVAPGTFDLVMRDASQAAS